MKIRKEKEPDVEAITEVTIAAFNTLPISNHTEQFIIKALRDAGALTISLVAEIDSRIAGHIAFSPVTVSETARQAGMVLARFQCFPSFTGRVSGSRLL